MDTNLEEALGEEEAPEEAEAEAEAEVEKAEELETEPEAEKPAEQNVPLAALLEVRDEKAALKAENAQLLQRIEAETKAEPKAAEVPDMFEDPDGFREYFENKISTAEQRAERKIFDARLDMSKRAASREHGAEMVDAMETWFTEKGTSDPHWAGQILGQPDPYDYALGQYKQEQAMAKLSGLTPEQIEALVAGQATDTPPPPEPVKLPQTTATARSASARRTPEWSGPTALENILPE